MAKKSTTTTLGKIDFKREATTRPYTMSMKLATYDRLEAEVEKGSWSQLIDLAINEYLDNYRRNHNGGQA